MDYDPFWRHQRFLEERAQDRLLAQLPRTERLARERAQVRLRMRLARALVALATWLSPDIRQPTPAFELSGAVHRNGTAA